MDDDRESVLQVTQAEDQMDARQFVKLATPALQDILEAYDEDDGRTLEEWTEELRNVIHHNND